MRAFRIGLIFSLGVLSGVKKQALLVVEQKKAELAQWIAKCNEGSAKLQKINEAIVSNSRKLKEWVKLVKDLGK
jgi:hypothetical protein